MVSEHTSYISENNMSKILSLTISIFTWCAWCSLICVTKILNASEADLVTPFEVRLWLNRHTTGFGKAHKMHLYLHKIHVTIRNEILRNHEMSRIPALQVMVDCLIHGCWVSKEVLLNDVFKGDLVRGEIHVDVMRHTKQLMPQETQDFNHYHVIFRDIAGVGSCSSIQ